MHKSNVSMQHKNVNLCFSFCWLQVLLLSLYPFFHPELSIILPLSEKLEVLGPPSGGRFNGRGRHYHCFLNEIWVCMRWISLGGLGLLMGSCIGYWVCGYFLYRRNLMYVPYYWILQITAPPWVTNSFSYLGKIYFSTIWTLSFFAEGGRSILFVHIYGDKCRC